VGTRLTTSADAPYLDCAYKLVEYAGRARAKTSEGKATLPGRKQVYRFEDDEGLFSEDVIALADETVRGRPLLEPVLREGKRVVASPTLDEVRARVREGVACLPRPLRALRRAPTYPVRVSPALTALAQVTAEQGSTTRGDDDAT
jgi:nicotinate phosphoribosyltransferase